MHHGEELKIPKASHRCWRTREYPFGEPTGDAFVGSATLEDLPEGYKPMAAFFPENAGLGAYLPPAFCVVQNDGLRGYDPRSLVEPGIEFVGVEIHDGRSPILLWDDRRGQVLAPAGELSTEYDWYEEPDSYLDSSDWEPKMTTKMGGVPYILQGEEELVGQCSQCAALCVFVAQLVGVEEIPLGDGVLYIFACPSGCEMRSKFQR